MRMIIRITLLFSLVCVYIFGKSLTRQVVLLGVVQTHIDKDYVDIIIDMRKPNRKTFMLNITINIFRDLENIQVKAQIYKFVEGRYKQTAFKYGGDICHYFKTVCGTLFQYDNLKEVFKNFITECPVKKGKYYVYNVNESIVRAPFIPAWKGKVDYSFSLDNISVYSAVAFFEVVEVSKS